jgi:exodeoxyribonuclease-3
LKVATYNVNGINGRLAVLLRWLAEAQPDVVCLQELKAPQERFPEAAIRDAGYGAIWHGQESWNGVAILARGADPVETRRGLPGDPEDTQSRYLEAAVKGVLIGCLYLPNGNPAPGPKFDYKLSWFERLRTHAADLLASGSPVVLAGDFNVMPTDIDVYKPERWVDDALFRPEVRDAFHRLLAQGWTDALRTMHPHERIYTFWDYFRNAWARDAGLRIDHILLSPSVSGRLKAAGVDREVRGWEKTSDHAPVWVDVGNAKPPVSRRPSRESGESSPSKRRLKSPVSGPRVDLSRSSLFVCRITRAPGTPRVVPSCRDLVRFDPGLFRSQWATAGLCAPCSLNSLNRLSGVGQASPRRTSPTAICNSIAALPDLGMRFARGSPTRAAVPISNAEACSRLRSIASTRCSLSSRCLIGSGLLKGLQRV